MVGTQQKAIQLRTVATPAGPIFYTRVRKRVKNLNLRVERDLSVVLSVPLSCPDRRADSFVKAKYAWIIKTIERLRRARVADDLPPELPRAECERILRHALDRVYPLVAGLGVGRPVLKLRRMQSQWGNCHWKQGYITLNVALARCPEELRDYVALHELVHFLHPDHGPGFYAQMDRLMPDWKSRRAKLKAYSGALAETENP